MAFSRQDYLNRIGKLQNLLSYWEVDGCLIENPIDIFYLLGIQLSTGTLILHKNQSALLVDGRYLQIAQTMSPVPALSLSDEEMVRMTQKCKTIAFDSFYTSVERYSKLQKLSSLKPIPNLLKELRAIKDLKEQKLLKKSALLLHKGFQHIEKKLKSGMTEKELALEFELFCRRSGAQKLSFESIIAFGENSAMPHYRSGEAKLKPGDIVLIDIGVVVDHYCSDMTRILFWKKPDSDLKRMLAVTKKAQKAAILKCGPGVVIKDLDYAAREEMKKENMEEYFIHHLGHGIGLEVHEYPRVGSKAVDKDLKLQPGMVITIEPGLYIPGKGGVRYEDMILITDTGYKKLTL